jgi:hypothetical protein
MRLPGLPVSGLLGWGGLLAVCSSVAYHAVPRNSLLLAVWCQPLKLCTLRCLSGAAEPCPSERGPLPLNSTSMQYGRMHGSPTSTASPLPLPLPCAVGLGPLPGEKGFWRFNRTQDYGYKGKNEDADALAKQFALKSE